MEKLRVLSLFAGIGGFDLGLERTNGFKTVAFCEIDPFCRRVLAKHWPGVPCYDDIRTLTAARLAADGIIEDMADADSRGFLEPIIAGISATGMEQEEFTRDSGIDIICGGFPCQDISVAGKGAGIDGARSGLWSEYARIIGEVHGGQRMTSTPTDRVRTRHVGHHKRLLAVPLIQVHKTKSVEERIAEAQEFRGELSAKAVNHIIAQIRKSARDFGELPQKIPPPVIDDIKLMIPGYPRVSEIIQLTASKYGISVVDIVSARRTKNIVRPRHIAMYLSKILTPRSMPELGRMFGGRDHTTVMYSVRKITRLIETDQVLAEEIEMLRGVLLS